MNNLMWKRQHNFVHRWCKLINVCDLVKKKKSKSFFAMSFVTLRAPLGPRGSEWLPPSGWRHSSGCGVSPPEAGGTEPSAPRPGAQPARGCSASPLFPALRAATPTVTPPGGVPLWVHGAGKGKDPLEFFFFFVNFTFYFFLGFLVCSPHPHKKPKPHNNPGLFPGGREMGAGRKVLPSLPPLPPFYFVWKS